LAFCATAHLPLEYIISIYHHDRAIDAIEMRG
jgi:hypothetical protein